MQEAISYFPTMQGLSYNLRMDDPRKIIASQAKRLGVDLSALSKAAGHNHAYAQQFIARGSPKVLPETTREIWAKMLKVPPDALRSLRDPKKTPWNDDEAPVSPEPKRILDTDADANGYHDGWRPALKGAIPQLDATGGLGDGSVGQVVEIQNGGITSGHLVVDEWVIPRSVLSISNLNVFAIPVDGTSMEPGLKTDDVVFVDTRPRGIKNDEIYVIDEGSGPEVKRLSLDRDTDPPVIVIGSDNPAATTRRRPADSVRVIGRVVGKFVKMASY